MEVTREQAKQALKLWGRVIQLRCPDEPSSRKSRIDALVRQHVQPVYSKQKRSVYHNTPINEAQINEARRKAAIGLICGYGTPVIPSTAVTSKGGAYPKAPDNLKPTYRVPDDPEDAAWIYLIVEMVLESLSPDNRRLAEWVYVREFQVVSCPSGSSPDAKWQQHYRLVTMIQKELESVVGETIVAQHVREMRAMG